MRVTGPCTVAQFAVERVLVMPASSAPPDVLQSYLKLLAEAYRKTHAYADKLTEMAGGAIVNTQACRPSTWITLLYYVCHLCLITFYSLSLQPTVALATLSLL